MTTKPLIIAISIEKGGNTRTTTTVNLSYALASKNYKVGIIDFDMQKNASLNLQTTGGSDLATCLKTVSIKLEDFSQTQNNNLFILKNNSDIAEDLFNQFQVDDRTYVLKDSLDDLTGLDFVFIDTPPSLQLQANNALVACDYVLAPCTLEPFAINGLQNLLSAINRLKVRTAPNIKLLGVIISKFSEVYSNNDLMVGSITSILGGDNLIFKSRIRQNISIPKSQTNKQSIYEYNDKKGVEDFNTLADEFLQKINYK